MPGFDVEMGALDESCQNPPATGCRITAMQQELPQPLLDVLDADQQAAVRDIFNAMDSDSSGELSPGEVKEFFSEEGQRTPRSLSLLDANGDGGVTFAEWAAFLVQLAQLGGGKGGRVYGTLKLLSEISGTSSTTVCPQLFALN